MSSPAEDGVTGIPANRPVGLVLSKLEGVRGNGAGFMARCPTHEDAKASLSIGEGIDGEALVYCFAGCRPENIVSAIGLRMADLFPPRENAHKPCPGTAPQVPAKITRYEIQDVTGRHTFCHVRRDFAGGGKDFYWEPKPAAHGVKSSDLKLYSIDKLPADVPVIVCEGEKAADGLTANGIAAVATVTGASGTPGDEALRPLLGRPVFLWPDADDTGKRHMGEIFDSLVRLGHRDIKFIDWKDAPAKGDAADLVSLEGWRDEFDVLIEAARLPEGVRIPKPIFESLAVMLSKPVRPVWLVEGLIETPSTGCIFAPSGAGKTFIAADLARAASTRGTWMGKVVNAPGPTFYLAGEGRTGLPRRFQALQIHHKAPIPADRLFISTCRTELDEKGAEEVKAAMARITDEVGAPPSLIIVDTLARALPAGADENSARDMGAFINVVDGIRDRFNCVVIIVHHTGHDEQKRARGSSSFRAAMDFELCVGKRGGERFAEWSKLKDLPDQQQPQEFNLKPVLIDATEDGELISSAVVEWKGTATQTARATLTTVEDLALKTLSEAIGLGLGATLEAWRPLFYAGHWGDNESSKRKSFQRVRDSLVAKKILRVEDNLYSINSKGYVR
jgi:hypothetical protein